MFLDSQDLKDSLALLELTAPQDNVGTLELKDFLVTQALLHRLLL